MKKQFKAIQFHLLKNTFFGQTIRVFIKAGKNEFKKQFFSKYFPITNFFLQRINFYLKFSHCQEMPQIITAYLKNTTNKLVQSNEANLKEIGI